MLIAAYTFSFIDRQILTLMVVAIRKTLKNSDTQLSLLHGFAFARFCSVMSIPIGRLVILANGRRSYRPTLRRGVF